MKRIFYKQIPALVLTTMCLSVIAETRGETTEWPLCPSSLGIPARPQVEVPLALDEVYITADEADLEEEGISVLHGNVEVTKGTQQISADTVTYDQTGETADLEGNIEFWDEEIYMQGERGHVEFIDNTGQLDDAKYKIKANRGRGDAEKIILNEAGVFDSWIEVDLKKYPDQLVHELLLLKSIVSETL